MVRHNCSPGYLALSKVYAQLLGIVMGIINSLAISRFQSEGNWQNNVSSQLESTAVCK
jgi:hypothetical protein